jgi:Cu-Zn family superoxide dismutase
MPVVASAILLACAEPQPDSMPQGVEARAVLRNAAGDDVGTATFREEEGEPVDILIEVNGLPAGAHGVHIHETGSCEPPDFSSAGAHFNPHQRSHGLENPQGPHGGDLPNLTVEPEGRGRLEAGNDRVTLAADANSLLDSDGSALVVHAAADDQVTDPSGNSGDRIACGVIERAGAS